MSKQIRKGERNDGIWEWNMWKKDRKKRKRCREWNRMRKKYLKSLVPYYILHFRANPDHLSVNTWIVSSN
jgi:hypothetical protein